MNSGNDILNNAVATLLGVTVEQLEDYVRAKREAYLARVARNNARYDALLGRITDVQAAVCEKLERDGHVRQNGIRVSRISGKIAVFYNKRVWDGAKGRLGHRLTAVYPDGASSTTLERSITVKSF